MKRAFAFGDKQLAPVVARVNAIKRVAVIGAGTMGQGIAIDLLQKTDYHVVLLDVLPEALKRAEASLAALWDGQVKGARIRPEDAQLLTSRVTYTQDYDDLGSADIIWEVATERAAIKAKIFEQIEQCADPASIAAVFSNTSSHTTAELAELFSKSAFREKFLTVHGYFPFESNRLLDVMKGKYASRDTYALGVVFGDQILEKTVIALPHDLHGYVTDPIFQGMGAIVSWDIHTADDLMHLGGLWEMFTANPFTVLDQTGHMPYTESSRHLGQALPTDNRLRSLYERNGKYYPDYIEKLEKNGDTGVNSARRLGFFSWSEGPRSKPECVYDAASGSYVPMNEISRSAYWSIFEAAQNDGRDGKIKSADSLLFVARADDEGGKAFRRYVLPICLYALDVIQDGLATAGQINVSTRAGLRFKVGLIELIDHMIGEMTIDGLLDLARRAQEENADDEYMLDMLDVDGQRGPRKGKPCLLHDLKKRNVTHLLGYGSNYKTPVAEWSITSRQYEGFYPELKFYAPSAKDRVASIVFNCPMRGNVFNKAAIDQLNHAYHRVLDLHQRGLCGGVLFSAAGTGMRMLGADAREFNHGWFERSKGYVPLQGDQARQSSQCAVDLFRMIQTSPVASIGVFGEKWGGGAEFTYYLDLRYDVRQEGLAFDTLDRQMVYGPKATYNQPELDYAILPGFGAAGELKRLGFGDSIAFEVFDQGMTADRAYQVGLSNGVFDEELDALHRGYERARLMAKDAPYSRALFKKQMARGIDDTALADETAAVFDPHENPYVSIGLLALLDRGGRVPKMNYQTSGIPLPGWTYPDSAGGMADGGPRDA
ncbi:MAG: hypothetical protein D8M59_12840 [Planctomycetes bacterium]|nr:hypothetical protein [Planctomycetota bacterium]NOG53703.1 hypothetical protein [Planctomycetota bacterium]